MIVTVRDDFIDVGVLDVFVNLAARGCVDGDIGQLRQFAHRGG